MGKEGYAFFLLSFFPCHTSRVAECFLHFPQNVYCSGFWWSFRWLKFTQTFTPGFCLSGKKVS